MAQDPELFGSVGQLSLPPPPAAPTDPCTSPLPPLRSRTSFCFSSLLLKSHTPAYQCLYAFGR